MRNENENKKGFLTLTPTYQKQQLYEEGGARWWIVKILPSRRAATADGRSFSSHFSSSPVPGKAQSLSFDVHCQRRKDASDASVPRCFRQRAERRAALSRTKITEV